MTDTMAEPRRVEFKTISTANKEEKEKKRPLIPRFALTLGESTATTCPEFSFTELVKKEKGRDGEPSLDPFGDEDDCHDEVAALAKKFEEKYGSKSTKKRKLKCLEDEYFDLGDGYDENDPFIDNTEAYDEVVPSCMTTKHGGFYINRGTLDFKTLSDQEDSRGEFITPVVRKRGRPRKILDSDEEEQKEGGEPKKKKIKKKKLKEGLEGEKKKKKKVSIGPDGEIIQRRKVISSEKKKKTSPTVKELLKQQTASTATPGTLNGDADDLSPAASPLPPQGDRSTIQDRIEAVICETIHEGDERRTNGSDPGQNQLPSDLPADLATAIVDIKKAAKDSKEGKCKFFTPNVNRLLLDIELASRQHSKRTSIYAHLADHLPCGKETLIKRAKKLRENQQDDQLKLPIQRLKEEIDKVMPVLQEYHEKEVAKARLENREKREGLETPREEGVNTESDDEDKSTTQGMIEGQSRKGNRDPRKKFKWTPEIRALLCQIVEIKMHMFDTYKFRNQTAEEYLKIFLENEIKILWPQGWIQTRMLYKETRSVHGSWTNPLKPKRPVLVTRSAASPTPTAPINSSPAISDKQPSDSVPNQVPRYPSPALEVIEVSDVDEPSAAAHKEKGRAAAATVLDIAEQGQRAVVGENLKISPKSMEAIAAATAAAVAAVSSPIAEPHPSLGERRPHLVSEILKKPSGLDTAAFPKSSAMSGPKTPPATVMPQSKDSISPFMAEFNRYLNSSPQVLPPGRLTQLPASQLQSKTVSSSTNRLDDKKLPPIQWQMEGLLGPVDKSRKLGQAVAGSSLSSSAHKGASLPASASVDLPAQQAHYQKMTAILTGQDLLDAAQRKTKGEVVRDQIFSRIQAEVEANSKPSPGRLSAEVTGKRTVAVSQTSARPSGTVRPSGGVSSPRQSVSYPHPSRQSPTLAHSPTSQRPSGGTVSAARQPSSPLSQGSTPTTPRQGTTAAPTMPRQGTTAAPTMPRQGTTAALTTPRQGTAAAPTKQQAMVPPHSTVLSAGSQGPGVKGQGSGMSPQGSSKSQVSAFRSQQSSPSQLSPPGARNTVPVRPIADPKHQKHSPSSTPVGAASPSSPASPAKPFHRGPVTSPAQSLVKITTSQGQGVRVSASASQGQSLKVTAPPAQRVTIGQSPVRWSSPTSATSQGQRNVVMSLSSSRETGQKLVSTPRGLQKLPGGAANAANSPGRFRPQPVSQPVYHKSETELDHKNRASPVQRPSGQAAAQLGSQVSNTLSKSSSATHSKPLLYSNPLSGSNPRPQEPSTAAGKAPYGNPPAAHTGAPPLAHSGTPPSAPSLTAGVHPQGSGSTPQAVDTPRPPQSYGQ